MNWPVISGNQLPSIFCSDVGIAVNSKSNAIMYFMIIFGYFWLQTSDSHRCYTLNDGIWLSSWYRYDSISQIITNFMWYALILLTRWQFHKWSIVRLTFHTSSNFRMEWRQTPRHILELNELTTPMNDSNIILHSEWALVTKCIRLKGSIFPAVGQL